MMRMRAAFAALVLLAAPEAAQAHVVIEGMSGFSGGLLHPLLVPAHILALLGGGLMAGCQSRRDGIALIAIFAGSLGVASGLVATAYAAQEPGLVLLAATAIAGLGAAYGRPLPLPASAIVVGLVAIALLLDSVPAVPSRAETMLALSGTALTAIALFAFVTMLSVAARPGWPRTGIRIAGSWCAASALLVLVAQLAR
ncbi:MAG: HupE/UreJ family protein [Pseudorhodoplanes sp.]|nr:HupE/UreJ family protein [Pseudorhodoplanes sp.]